MPPQLSGGGGSDDNDSTSTDSTSTDTTSSTSSQEEQDTQTDTSTSDSTQETSTAAEEELTSRDPGSSDSTTDTTSGGSTTDPDPAPSGGGVTSGGGETATHADDTDPAAGDTTEETAREELEARDPGSDTTGGGTQQAREELRGRDPGSRDVEQMREEAVAREARAAATETVDRTIQEGVEGEAGRQVTVDGTTVDARGQAQSLEQRAIEEAAWADNPEDVAVVVRDGNLVAIPSRSATVDDVAERIEEDVESDIEARERRRGQRLATIQKNQQDQVTDADLEEIEEELETTGATLTVPESVPVFGPGGQVVDVQVPIGDITLSGQTRDVEVEQTEDGLEVTEAERFGDFDIGDIPESFTYTTMGGMKTEIDIPGGGGEFEDVTGAIGDRFVGAGETAGDVLARELVEERTILPGAVVEEQITGDTSFTASATRNVPVGAAGIADQALNLPQETAEFVAEGTSRVASGEGKEFSREVAGAATGAGIMTASSAKRDPGQFVGQLSGSAVTATGGIAGATRLAGPGAGRAVSVAVQPGEELAIAASRSGAVSPGTAALVPGVRRGHIESGGTEAVTETEQTDTSTGTVEVQDPMVGRVEGAVVGRALSARVRARNARERVREISAADVEAAVTRPARAARQRGRELRSELRGTLQGAQLSAEAQVTRGAEGLQELVRKAQTPPRPEARRVDLDADELAESNVEVERAESVEDADASGAGVGSVGGVSETRTGSGVAVQRVRGKVEFDEETETVVESGVKPKTRQRSVLETARQAEAVVTPEVEGVSDVAVGSVVSPELRAEQGAELATEPVLESGVESRLEHRVESKQELKLETRTEARQELRQELTTEPVSELRSELDTDPRFETETRRGRRRRSPEDAITTFEYDVASPEEVLEGDLGALDDNGVNLDEV